MAKTMHGHGPQYPAGRSNRSTTAERNSRAQRLLKISGSNRPSKPHITTLAICTYNCRSLAGRTELTHLMEEKKKIKCDVLGLCETRRKEELHAKWNDGNAVRLGKGDGTRTVGGVGFIISKEWAEKVVSCQLISSRIGILNVQVSKKATLKIIQTYAPTNASDDDEIEEFYRELEGALAQKSTYTIVMGDFNAKVGKGRQDERYTGKFGLGERNERGERLVAFAETNKLYIGNSLFKKRPQKRWTWIAPNAQYRNEIDYILIDRRRLLQDVSVVEPFNTGSDHRLLRAKLVLDNIREKKALHISLQNQRSKVFDEMVLQDAIEKENWSQLEDIDADYDSLTKKLKACFLRSTIDCQQNREERLSVETKQLMEKRKNMKRSKENIVEYSILCKAIRQHLKEDLEKFKIRRLLKAAEQRKSMKKCRRELAQYTRQVTALKNKDGQTVTNKRDMEEVCKTFYTNLFKSSLSFTLPSPQTVEELPPIMVSEIENALHLAKSDKAPGKDGITTEMLKSSGETFWKALTTRFNRYLKEGKVPSQWKGSNTILLHKKGDKEDLKNYRPICLLSHIYKLFTKIIVTRLSNNLDYQQPREQAGFRKNYSTMDHIFTLTQLIERAREYKLPLCVAFVDYEKAFDSVEINAVLTSLQKQGIEAQYINLLKEANSNCTTDIKLLPTPVTIPVGKGVKQGDTISPKLFTACLEMVLRDIDWDGGININGELLNHLRFADDIVLIAKTTSELQAMLTKLNTQSKAVGLQLNRMKTKFMRSENTPPGQILVEGVEIEEVKEYAYLGQIINMDRDMAPEIARRITSGWRAFNSIKDVLKSKIDRTLRAHLFNSTVLPAMLYASETWATTKREEQRLITAQRAMERCMLGVSLRDHIRCEEIRRRSGIKDVIAEQKKQKLRWAGHVARMNDNRWTCAVAEWYPRGQKRPLGRPPRRWRDEIEQQHGKTWQRKARSRAEWKCIVVGNVNNVR